MKNPYFFLLVICVYANLQNTSFAQSVLKPTDSVAEYDPGNPPVQPPYGQIGKWVRTKSLSWNSDSYKAYIYKGSCFRLKFPKTYNPSANDGKKYPIALVFHGGGEVGPITDNETELYHGGLEYMNAVDSGAFDGYVLFMQSQGFWGISSYAKIIDIVNYMVVNNKVDPFRISANGLSSGGQASWEMVFNYPNYIGASLPMSSVSIGYKDPSTVNKVKFTPIWNFQGQLDGSPAASTAQQVRDAMVAAGGNYRYSEYRDIGHGTWDSAFAEPDFFPFMVRAYSSNPWALYGRTNFCNGDAINITLGVPPGFVGYQWRKNNVLISGATGNTLTINSLGTYDARVLRDTTWSDWSHIPVVIQITPPTVTPPITVSGLMSNVIVSGDNKNYVNLEVPDNGYTSYTWKKVGSNTIISQQRIYTANQPGEYIVAVTQPYGCSTIFSPLFKVIDANGQNPPDAATNLTANTISSTQIALSWENDPHPVFNETFFEIYRSTSSNGPYSFVGKAQRDTLKYTDSKLLPGINYFYKIRAVNDSGAAPLSKIASAITKIDETPPTAPGNLKVIYATNTSVSLQWSASVDDVGIKYYQIYVNGIKSYTTTRNNFIISALQQGSAYSFYIKAVDFSGNYSPQSNIANSPSALNGLVYKYYEGYWLSMPDFSSLTPLSTGVSANINLGIARRQTQFGVLWQGYINIPVTGRYKFKTISNDGSQVWLNTYDPSLTPLVNNDGYRTGNKSAKGVISLQAGTMPISIAYFQTTNNKSMKLYWSNSKLFGDSEFHEIENKYFAGNYTPSDTTPATPDNISASAVSYDKISITWSDESNNEKGFQVYRSFTSGGAYKIVFTTDSNVTSYVDSGLTPSTKYFYKINAVNNYGASPFTDNISAKTFNLPLPLAPSNFKAKALSVSSIRLTWNDRDTGETNYQVFRSVSDTFNFKPAALLPANSTSFTDTGLYGNINYFYRLNAINTISSSLDKATTLTSAKTKNNPPVIISKFSHKYIPYGIQSIVQIKAIDADADPLSFYAVNLPSFANLVDNGNGTASLIFNPSLAQQGNYTNVKLFVKDTLNGKDSDIFTLTVNNNYYPLIDSIPDYTMNEGDSLIITLNASDQNSQDSLTWSVSGFPFNYSLIPAGNGKFSLILMPGYNAAGTYKVQVTADDGNEGTTTRLFNLAIHDKDPSTIVSFRFKDQDSVGFPWNDIASVSSTNSVDNFHRNTNTGLTLQTSWWATGHEGPQTGDNSGIYPDNVSKDYYYFGISGGPQTVTGKITGLDISKRYDISFYGASNWNVATDNGSTIYTIGSQSIPVHVQNNISNTADFNNTQPAADGTITFTMSKAANTAAGYINAIVIKSLYADSLISAAPAYLAAINIPGKVIQLSWYDAAYNETGYNVYRSLNAAGSFTLIKGNLPANTSTYLDSTVAGSTEYFYMVKASNLQGTSDPSNIATIITPDRVPVIQPISSVTIKNNQQKIINVVTTDDGNDHTTLTAGNMPDFVTFTDNGNGTGTFTISPTAGISGIYEDINLKATDNSDSSSSYSFNITVTDQNLNSVYINFSNGSTESAPWNNFTAWPSANSTLSNLHDDNNAVTAISLKLINGFQGNIAQGMQPGNNRGIYTETVIRTGEYEGSTRIDSILISGLSQNKKYNFVFFNSHDDELNGNTNFAINDQNVSLNATHNINTTAQINGIMPDATGKVYIRVSKAAGAAYAYINSLIIQSYDSAQKLLKPFNLRVVGITKKTVSLQWADGSSDETGFEIWRATDSNSNYSLLRTVASNISSYTDSNLNSGYTYYYTVRAIKPDSQSVFCNAVSATTYSQAIYVNFTFQNNAKTPWNNTSALPELGLTWNNFFDDSGIPSSIGMEETGIFAGLYTAGVNTGNNSGIFPDKVLTDSYVLFPGQSATMKITGLNLNMKYDFTFFASSQASGDVNSAYTVNDKKAVLNASLNTSGTVTIYNVTPDENGEAVITIAPNNSTSQYGMITALVIQEYKTSGNSIPAPQLLKVVNSSVSSIKTAPITKQNKMDKKAFAFPNPFNYDFTVSLSLEKKDNIQVEVYDVNGKLVSRKNFGDMQQGSHNLKIAPGQNISAGLYFVKVIYANAKVTNFIKIIKQ
jgi:predicted esterase